MVLHMGKSDLHSSKLYNLPFVNVQVPDTHRWIWKSKYVPRIKLFASLMFVDRLNTRTMLKRSNSTSIEEDIDHLFFACPFATRCWNTLNIQWDLHFNFHGRLLAVRRGSHSQFFMEIFMEACWELWKLKNGFFYGDRASHSLWVARFKEQSILQMHRVFESEKIFNLLFSNV